MSKSPVQILKKTYLLMENSLMLVGINSIITKKVMKALQSYLKRHGILLDTYNGLIYSRNFPSLP